MEERHYTIAEATKALGYSRQTISTWIKTGKIVAIRVDKSVRIPESEIEKYKNKAQIMKIEKIKSCKYRMHKNEICFKDKFGREYSIDCNSVIDLFSATLDLLDELNQDQMDFLNNIEEKIEKKFEV